MSALWVAVIVVSVASFLQKWIGYQVPASLLERPVVARITTLLPLALLGALVAVQTATAGPLVVADARLLALAVAAVLLWRRAPFLVVVITAALTAAAAWALGLG
ncbi:AzlD domain-containing protein [Brachybacterium sp. EF45031]|uniref:AzlD domain-containing protein n=1 Tax=Brachybacterium sillae TaxID=2810536 RepID=UPI00217DE13B|nr:AzlD domain-containing protein [Brachybacterium sillae]MCS6712360.1 AzlD domain-containing protein [Brachybacterium sillae]